MPQSPHKRPSPTAIMQTALVTLAALALLAAAYVGVLVSGETVHRTLTIVEDQDGIHLHDASMFTYTDQTSYTFVSQEEDVPFVRVHAPPSDHHCGVGVIIPPWPENNLHLRLRWRRTGPAHIIQIDVHERGSEPGGATIFSSWDHVPTRQWSTVEIPLRRILWNVMANPPPAQNRPMQEDHIEAISFTFEPDTEYHLDVAAIDLVRYRDKWSWITALVGGAIVALGVANTLRLQGRRRQAETHLRESEAHYESIFNVIGEGILALDPKTDAVLTANRTACSLLGYVNTQALQADAIHALGRLLAGGRAGETHFEWSFERADGEAMTLDVILQRAQLGDAPRLLAILRDIREHKQARAERIALENQLQQAQKMEAIGRLAGGVAHDFNNILTGIICTCEMAALSLPPDSDLTKSFQQIHALSERASKLTRQLLAFSRRQEIQRAIVHANPLIAGALKLLNRVIGEDVQVVFESHARNDRVNVDGGQIEQVLMNLAVNARDAMPRGGTLTLTTSNRILNAAHGPDLAPGEYLAIEVADTGHGMDAKTLAHIFEPFFTTKEVGKGTGLGLPMAYGIVRQHQGDIQVESLPEMGTTFTVLLPCADALIAPNAPEDNAPPPGGDEGVFVVEDDANVRDLVVRVLLQLGYRVYWAEGPEAAEQLFPLHADEVTLLLTDVVMPGASGPELYQRLLKVKPTLQALLMSGYPDRIAGDYKISTGALPMLSKPFRPAELARAVRDTLNQDAPSP